MAGMKRDEMGAESQRTKERCGKNKGKDVQEGRSKDYCDERDGLVVREQSTFWGEAYDTGKREEREEV